MHLKLVIDSGNSKQVDCTGCPTATFGNFDSQWAGPWAEWNWDGWAFTLRVDRYGFYPIFYGKLANGIAVSDSIEELLSLGVSTTTDDDAIAAFLRLGFFLGEDTPWQKIRVLPPGGKLTWEGGRTTIEGGPIPQVEDSSIGRGEAVDSYIERFRDAIERTLPENPQTTALPLSGGRDSRHIALELHRQGFRPGLVFSQHHNGSRLDNDAPVARRVCDALGWNCIQVARSADPLGDEIVKNQTFDFLTDEHGWFMPSARMLNSQQIETIFDGIAGDALSQGLFSRPEWRLLAKQQRWQDVIAHLRFGAPEWVLRTALTAETYKRWGPERAVQRILSELCRHGSDERTPERFMFWNRTRREIAPFLIRYCPDARIVTPYLYPPLFDYLRSLPLAVIEDRAFHDAALKAGYPTFSEIPFADDGNPPDPSIYTLTLIRSMAARRRFWLGGPYLNRAWLRPRLLAGSFSRTFALRMQPHLNWIAWLAGFEMIE